PDIFITFLNYIPIAALGVLIFPGILSAVETPLEGILGGIFAAILGIFRVPLFFVVVLSVSFIYLIILIIYFKMFLVILFNITSHFYYSKYILILSRII